VPVIATVGSINMDLVVRAPRFAAPGETLTGSAFLTVPGGKGANQSVAAQRIGAQVALIARVGDDAFGRAMRQGLEQEGLDVRHVATTPGTPTGVALITVDDQGENTIIVVPGANGALQASDVDQARDVIARADVLMLQLEIPVPVVTQAIGVARESGVTVVLNAAPAQALQADLLSGVDYLIVNATEAAVAAGLPPDTAFEEAAGVLRARGAGAVVVTLGAAGAVLVGDGPALSVPAFDVDVVDTTAAGDAFAGAFAVAIAEGASPADALQLGTAAGALAVTTVGAQPSLPTRAAVDALRNRRV